MRPNRAWRTFALSGLMAALLVVARAMETAAPRIWNSRTHIGGLHQGRLWSAELPSEAQGREPHSTRKYHPLDGYTPLALRNHLEPRMALGGCCIGPAPRPVAARSVRWIDAGHEFDGRAWWVVSLAPALYLGACLLVIPAGLGWHALWLNARGGYCFTCGYNLTGNTSGRCPECGAVIVRGE
jgi:hypothetical protein